MKRKSDDNRMERRKKYRTAYQEQHAKILSTMPKNRDDIKITDVVLKPHKVDVEKFCGTQGEFQFETERFYENRGPILDNCGQDFALQAHGIYYLCHFSEQAVRYGRKVWVPTLPEQDEETPETLDRRARAKTLASHSRKNEAWCKSEFGWEADAWADIFGRMRDEPTLEIDKRGLSFVGPKT
ncbi:hypothetical protein NA57DRAFT_60716 [Rhizodiscina lignyota]|uniref:Uncharacterized protein n=1 Tax=Rhizodiscina lignyota TaxID=1504668 RepID=A0A9P4I318_9PEZI|nr:hypothetical protein NA57DRAFT_60716 [Rhizodiscina lignyota]